MSTLRRTLEATLGQPPQRFFSDFSLVRRAWEGVGCAALSGAVSGLALGANLWLYLASAGLAGLAGVPAATQHRTLPGALVRTTLGGLVWAAAVLGAFLLTGRAAVTTLPDPLGWYLLLATAPATLVGWAVWSLADRLQHSARPHPPVESGVLVRRTGAFGRSSADFGSRSVRPALPAGVLEQIP